MTTPLTANLPFLTADLPGIGGRIKQRPSDFVVEEIPLYEPVGEGEHLYVFIQKRSRTTSEVIKHLSRCFYVGRREIGYAGLKDKHAVTRQHFSIHLPGAGEDRIADGLARIPNDTVKLLWAKKHGNKLRRGHLVGNRFIIRIRDVEAATIETARTVLDELAARGVPNFLGRQRFGYRQDNHLQGRLLLLGQWQALLDMILGDPRDENEATHRGRIAYAAGEYEKAIELWPRQLRSDRQALDALRQGKNARQAVMHIDRDQRKFLISGVQSAIFNRVLEARVQAGTFDRLLPGDVAMKTTDRAVFTVDANDAEQENAPGGRIATGEITPTGPMWGADMLRPTGEIAEMENRMLGEFNLQNSDFDNPQLPDIMPEGSRRPLRIKLTDPQIETGEDERGAYLQTSFALPRGSFATIVLREIMKIDDLEGRDQRRESTD